MLLHFIFSLVTVAALPLNNSNSIRDNQSSLNNSILCSADSPTDSIDRKRISHKIQLGKLKLKKQIWNEKLSVAHVEGHTRRPRIVKRSTLQLSSEDDSDLVKPTRQTFTVNHKAELQDKPVKHIINKDAKFSKLLASRPNIGMDTKCNSQELRELMIQSISQDSSVSKRLINNQAEAKFGGSIDVICSKGHFSYVYNSNLFCEAKKGDITCIAFRQTL